MARLSNGLLAGESHLSTHVSPNDRGDRWKDLTPEETRKVRGGGRFVPSRPGGSHIEHGWTGPGALPDTAGSASVAGREQEVNKGIGFQSVCLRAGTLFRRERAKNTKRAAPVLCGCGHGSEGRIENSVGSSAALSVWRCTMDSAELLQSWVDLRMA